MVLLFDWEDQSRLLQFFIGLALSAGAAYAYQLRKRNPILDDHDLLKDLSPEQRIRLELKLGEDATQATRGPLEPPVKRDTQVAALVEQLVAESRQRQRRDLNPAEQIRLREELETLLRARWESFADALTELARDPSGASWVAAVPPLQQQLDALHAELREGKLSGCYPALALQLEGPLETIALVLRHACEASTLAAEGATRQRQGVLVFLDGELPAIRRNLRAQ
jgi:hypothetical protein